MPDRHPADGDRAVSEGQPPRAGLAGGGRRSPVARSYGVPCLASRRRLFRTPADRSFQHFLPPIDRHGRAAGGAGFVRLSRTRAHRAWRVLRPGALCGRRHGRDGQRRRTDDRIRGPRSELDFHLHPGGIPPRRSGIERSGDEVFSAGLVRDGIFPLRRGSALRRYGHDAARSDDPHRSGGCAGTVPPRTGAGAGGTRIQGGRRAVSDVDAGRVPGRAHAGDRAHGFRTEGGGVCAAAAHSHHSEHSGLVLVLGAVDLGRG